MSFHLLPTEVLILVSSFLEREELKALRLTNPIFLGAATARLFSEIHISPNSHSFQRAHSVASLDYLRVQVKSLVYHFGMLEDAYPGFDTFRHEYLSARKPGQAHNPSEVTSELIWCYNCFLEEMDGQRTFEYQDEEEELKALCCHLPNLESISTLLDDVQPFSELKDYIGRRTGMAAVADEGEARFTKLFKAIGPHTLSKLSAKSIQWMDLKLLGESPPDVFENYRICLRGLKYFEIGLYSMSSIWKLEEDENMEEFFSCINCLDRLLKETCHITTLKLDFEEIPFESHAAEMLPVSKTIFGNHWPMLQELKLEAVCALEDELFDFLNAHRNSLEKLCIGDIELVKQDSTVPSILRLFQRLRESLNLHCCKITGNFTNRIDQAWYVDIECKQPNCLRDQIEAYLCRASTRAIGHSSSGNGEGMDQAQWSKSAGLDLGLWVQGESSEVAIDNEALSDDSWYWCPELLEGD